MTRAPRCFGGVLVPVLTLVGVFGLGAATVITIPHPTRPGDDAAAARPLSAKAKHNLDVAATDSLLRRVKLTPDTMAAAGLSAQDADMVIMAALVHVQGGEVAAELRAATVAYNQAVQAAGRTKPGEQQVSSATRAENLANARAELNGILDTAWTLVTGSLSAEQKTKLTTIRANAQWGGMPAQYLVSERTSADWVRLRGALAHERFASREGFHGPALTQENQTFLNGINDDVSGAAADIQTNRAPIEAAWQAKLAPEE